MAVGAAAAAAAAAPAAAAGDDVAVAAVVAAKVEDDDGPAGLACLNDDVRICPQAGASAGHGDQHRLAEFGAGRDGQMQGLTGVR